MLTRLELANFKSFGKLQSIPMKPLTLIFGPNSSGKSSIIQSLLLLKQTIDEAQDRSDALLPKGKFVDLGSFRDFVHGHVQDRDLSISLVSDSGRPNHRVRRFFPGLRDIGGRFEFSLVRRRGTGGKPEIIALRRLSVITAGNREPLLSWRLSPGGFGLEDVSHSHPLIREFFQRYMEPGGDPPNEPNLMERLGRGGSELNITDLTSALLEDDVAGPEPEDLQHPLRHDSRTTAWLTGFNSLLDFLFREGDARIASRHVEGGFRLGSWAADQRRAFKAGDLPMEQACILEQLPGWKWEYGSNRNRRCLKALTAFSETNGHTRVPPQHSVGGIPLGAWVRQRRLDFHRGDFDLRAIVNLMAVPNWTFDLDYPQDGETRAAARQAIRRLQRLIIARVGSILREEGGPKLSGTRLASLYRWLSFPARLKMEHFLPGRGSGADMPRTYATAIDVTLAMARGVASALDDITYLGPLREYPARHYIFSGSSPANVGTTGARLPDLLRTDSELLASVNGWLERLEIGYSVKLAHGLILQDVYEIQLIRDGVAVSIRDVGFGISQVLPVIAQALLAKNKILCFEQPEIHLHPKLQSEIGDLLLEAAFGDGGNQVIVETHSEHVILRIMRRIRESSRRASTKKKSGPEPDIRPDDVSVLYVDTSGSEARVREIRLGPDGELLDPWPGGFFEEGHRERSAGY